jgi:hypothetical protein
MQINPHYSIRPTTSSRQLVTQQDLLAFKAELIKEILTGVRVLVQDQPQRPPKKWLKSYEVRKLLGICPATLQGLRDNGTIPYSRLGHDCYYDPQDVERELERRKTVGRNRSGQFTRRS